MGRDEAHEWLRRARSNLALGKAGQSPGVLLEDLCFELQQATEKALKAILIHANLTVPRTHSLAVLLQHVEATTELPEPILRAVELSDYAVQTRYPGDYAPVTQEEFQDAVSIAEDVVNWAAQHLDSSH